MKRNLFLTTLTIIAFSISCYGKGKQQATGPIHAAGANENHFKSDMTMNENLILTQQWDKVFPQSDQVNHSKVTFRNRYGITLAADLYVPKNAAGKLPAIAVCGSFRSRKRTIIGLVCADNGRAWLPDPCIRPFLYG